MSLSGPTALITGASSGLGVEYARHYASVGHRVVLVARDTVRLSALAQELSETFGVDAEVLAADLHIAKDRNRVAERLRSVANPVRVLVNNAGYGIAGEVDSSDPQEEADHLTIHVTAPLELTKAALPGMLERGEGRIIIVSSVAGYLARGTYSAHKAWGLTFARSANETYRRRGVHVSAVAPGFTRTEFHQRMAMETAGIPGVLWLSAPRVVLESVRAVEKGRAVVIPSSRYKILVAVAALLPKKFHQATL
jgi:short-subunit dehydrogenase